MIHLTIEHGSSSWYCRPAAPLDAIDDPRWMPSFQLRDLARIGIVDLDPDQIDYLSWSESNRICREVVKTFQEEPSSLERLTDLLCEREELEKVHFARREELLEAVEAGNVPISFHGDLPRPDTASSNGLMRCLVAFRYVYNFNEEPIWCVGVPDLGFWLHGKVVGLIEDAVEAFHHFLMTLKLEDRRRTLRAILANKWAVELRQAVTKLASTFFPPVAWLTPQIESSGGWSSLHAPVL